MYIGYEMELIESFVDDRKAVQTEKQLKAFTKHWNAVWKIPWHRTWEQTREESQLVSGRYDASTVLRCIHKNSPSSADACSHIKRDKHCLSTDIMAPALLFHLFELRISYEAPDGVILLQLLRTMHKDLNDTDLEDIIMYLNEHRTFMI